METEKIIENLASISGVYRIFEGEELVYIGQSRHIKTRLKDHPHVTEYTTHILCEEINHNGRRLIKESKLIAKYQPKYNKAKKDNSFYKRQIEDELLI